MSNENQETNGRTHEPSLRELVAEMDGLRELVLSKIQGNKEILDERDKLYTERDNSRRTAVEAALTAVKEQTKASFDASEKAIVKAEDGQRSYNTAHNDLARKMDEQNKATMPRLETESRFQSIEEKIVTIKDSVGVSATALMKEISSLRESRSSDTGQDKGTQLAWGYIVAGVAVVGSLVTMLVTLLKFAH